MLDCSFIGKNFLCYLTRLNFDLENSGTRREQIKGTAVRWREGTSGVEVPYADSLFFRRESKNYFILIVSARRRPGKSRALQVLH
jgi:hypothetical protein